MLAYIKRKSDFINSTILTIIDYDIAVDSVYDDASSMTAVGEITGVEGDWIYLDGWLGVIESVSPDKGQTVISCRNILTAFNRLLTASTGTYIEAFIKSTLESEYKNLSDTVYALPYLNITTTTSTAFISPDLDDDGLWTVKSYIAKVRRLKSVFCVWSISGDTLNCVIGVKAVPTQRIDFADRSHRLQAESYSSYKVAKVTALQMADGVLTATTQYYLHSDGTYDTTDTDRVTGDWTTIVTDADKEADAVAEVFAKSAFSHLVEFNSDRTYSFYDSLQIRINGRVLLSYISCVRRSMREGVTYKSGELRLSYTEKIKEMI